MDVYASLEVGSKEDAHTQGGEVAIAWEKILRAYGEFAAFAHAEQHWHARRSFSKRASSIGSSSYIWASLSLCKAAS